MIIYKIKSDYEIKCSVMSPIFSCHQYKDKQERNRMFYDRELMSLMSPDR